VGHGAKSYGPQCTPAGQRGYATIVVVAITAWIGSIAVGSLVALARR
jgi:hypothetical protein